MKCLPHGSDRCARCTVAHVAAAATLVLLSTVSITSAAQQPDAGSTDGTTADGAADADGGSDGGYADDETPVTDPKSDDTPDTDPDRGSTSQADRAAAESLFKVGKGLMDLGQLEEARDKLRGSLDAHFTSDAALLLGECQEKRGLIASAWASYRQAASRLRALGDVRAPMAKQRADVLNVQVPRLTIEATSVPGLEIVRGDTHFGDGVLGVALAVDPGTHLIEARAPGFLPYKGEITIRASERKTLVVPALIPAPAKASTKDATTPLAADGHGPWWTAGLITGAAGIVTLGVGALFGGLAAAKIANAEEDETLCGVNKVCSPEGISLVEEADRFGIASTVLLSVGGVAVASGFVMLLIDEPETRESAKKSSASVTPWFGPTGAGISVGGSF